MNIRTSFVISTLLRDSLYKTIHKIRAMFSEHPSDDLVNIPIYAIYDPNVNEYVVRNEAVDKYVKTEFVTFIDDDAYPDRDFYKRLEAKFDECDIITGRVYSVGKYFGEKYHGIGTNLTVRVSVFKELGGFEENWGVPDFYKSGFGWRSDTDLLWRYLKKYGENRYCHDDNLLVIHPEVFKSEFILPIEIRFINRHRDLVDKFFAPIDPRVTIVESIFIDGKINDSLKEWINKDKTLMARMFNDVILQITKYKKYIDKYDENVMKALRETLKII